MRNHSALN